MSHKEGSAVTRHAKTSSRHPRCDPGCPAHESQRYRQLSRDTTPAERRFAVQQGLLDDEDLDEDDEQQEGKKSF